MFCGTSLPPADVVLQLHKLLCWERVLTFLSLFGIQLSLAEMVFKFPKCLQGKDFDTQDEEKVEDESELVLKLDGKNIDGKSLQSIFERRCQLAVCDSFLPSIPIDLKDSRMSMREAGRTCWTSFFVESNI
jgi:hypothetical protein